MRNRLVEVRRNLTRKRNKCQRIEQDLRRVVDVLNLERRYVNTYNHSFTEEITSVPLPDRFKVRTVNLYEGTTDPDDHIKVFEGHMVLHKFPEVILCR